MQPEELNMDTSIDAVAQSTIFSCDTYSHFLYKTENAKVGDAGKSDNVCVKS